MPPDQPAGPTPAALPRPERLRHLDGLRGIAACQVLLLHGFGAFIPALVAGLPGRDGIGGAIHLSPAYALYDGESAVTVFFLLSSFVLTLAFARETALAAALAARVLRLALPGAAAALLAWALFLAFPDAHREAGELLGSAWLRDNWAADGSLASLLREAVLDGPLLGFRGLSALDAVLGDGLRPNLAAYAAPLWTLSAELHGSALVLLLAAARRHSRLAWAGLLLLLGVVLARSPLLCFPLGHVLAVATPRVAARIGDPRFGRRPVPVLRRCVPLLLAVAGLALTTGAEGGALPAAQALSAADPPVLGRLLLPGLGAVALQREAGAALVFLAVLASPGLHARLRHPALAWLGRVSFPLYLVHWGMILGPGAALAVRAAPLLGESAARGLALATALALSVAAACAFRPVDDLATAWARRLRALFGPERVAGGRRVVPLLPQYGVDVWGRERS